MGTLPDDISVIQKRAKEAGSLGICIADRRVGYRAKASELAEVKRKLGHEDFVTWKLAGAPLSCSAGEAVSWLQELHAEGKVLDHTRRVRRGTQEWLIRIPAGITPKSDTLSVTQGTREYLLTLSQDASTTRPTPGHAPMDGCQ